MYLVEKHIISENHSLFKEIDQLCFLSKNLYNRANYIVRQEFITTSKLKESGLTETANYLNYNAVNKIMIQINDSDYIKLPRKVSNKVLDTLHNNWLSFFASIKDYVKNPSKYTGRPSLPRYLDKKGRFFLKYELQAISKRSLKNKKVKLSGTNIEVPFVTLEKDENIRLVEARIVPKLNNYVIEIVYEKLEEQSDVNFDNILGIDLGISNLMTLTSNKRGLIPQVVNGRPLKSINQYYNKKLSEYKSQLPFRNNEQLKTSRKIKRLTTKRNLKVEDYLHKSSKYIVNFCLENKIGTIVIGKNKQWKTESNLGDKNNQNFIQIPFNKLIFMIEYKARLKGITVIVREESYTSKASFLDLDKIPTYSKNSENEYKFSGKRIKRGMYKSKEGKKINADVNGSYNIIRKEFPNAFGNGIEDVAVHPVRVSLRIK